MEMVHMRNYITFNDAITDFQNLITDTNLLTLPFFNTTKKKFAFVLECKSSLDRSFDAIISHLTPTSIFLIEKLYGKMFIKKRKKNLIQHPVLFD